MGGRNTRTRVSEPIHGLSGRIRSLQRKAITSSGSGTTSVDQAVTAVDLSHAWVEAGQGNSKAAGATTSSSNPFLTSATNARIWTYQTAGSAAWRYEVIEVY